MTFKCAWKSWPAGVAALFLMSAAPVLAQPVGSGPSVTVYESPT